MFRTGLQNLWKHGRKAFKEITRTERNLEFGKQIENHGRCQELVSKFWGTDIVSVTNAWSARGISRSISLYIAKEVQSASLSSMRSPFFLNSTARGVRSKLPLMSLLAGCFVIKSQMEELNSEQLSGDSDSLCSSIRTLWGTFENSNVKISPVSDNQKSSEFVFSKLIGQGCNSAVYSAFEKLCSESSTSEELITNDSVSENLRNESSYFCSELVTSSTSSSLDSQSNTTSLSNTTSHSFEILSEESCVIMEKNVVIVDHDKEDNFVCFDLYKDHQECSSNEDSGATDEDSGEASQYSSSASSVMNEVAVKIIFNYHIESNEEAIVRGLAAELVPSSVELGNLLSGRWQNGLKLKHLPPHPNIVQIKSAFVDIWPADLPQTDNFPLALPKYLYEDGYGKNMTLFITMDRYPFTLENYLSCHKMNSQNKALVLLQLLEALCHLEENQVSHRDLKMDNVLCREENGQLWVALSDFGSCLVTDLQVPYYTDQILKGGNWNHLAPEITSATPGRWKYLDYRKADIWAVGLMACEIFAFDCWNEHSSWLRALAEKKYTVDDIPPMFLKNNFERCIGNIVRLMLLSNPHEACKFN